MSDQENHLNTSQDVTTLPSGQSPFDPKHLGWGAITASTFKHTSYVFAIDGLKIIELTKELGEGKIKVSNEHIRTLLERNPAAHQAMWTILDSAKDDVQAVVIREALNTFFTSMLNEFHKDLRKRAEANGR